MLYIKLTVLFLSMLLFGLNVQGGVREKRGILLEHEMGDHHTKPDDIDSLIEALFKQPSEKESVMEVEQPNQDSTYESAMMDTLIDLAFPEENQKGAIAKRENQNNCKGACVPYYSCGKDDVLPESYIDPPACPNYIDVCCALKDEKN